MFLLCINYALMFLFQVHPKEMKATSKFGEANRLQIDEGDMVIVIDGRWGLVFNSCSTAVSQ